MNHALFVRYVLVAAFDDTRLERISTGRSFLALGTALRSSVGGAFAAIDLFILAACSSMLLGRDLHDHSL